MIYPKVLPRSTVSKFVFLFKFKEAIVCFFQEHVETFHSYHLTSIRNSLCSKNLFISYSRWINCWFTQHTLIMCMQGQSTFKLARSIPENEIIIIIPVLYRLCLHWLEFWWQSTSVQFYTTVGGSRYQKLVVKSVKFTNKNQDWLLLS